MQEPQARKRELIIQGSGDEVVVFDAESNRVHRLNRTAAFVWNACDGRTPKDEIARRLEHDLGTAGGDEAVALALDRLDRARLLDSSPAVSSGRGVSRREALRRIALVGGTVAMLPVVTSILAPTPAQAATPLPCKGPGIACTADADCCSNKCLLTNLCL